MQDYAMKTPAAFFCSDEKNIDYVYAKGRRRQVEELTDLYPTVINNENFAAHQAALTRIEVIFSTWGMLCLTAEQLAALPNLKAVFYAAGATDGFARPLLQHNIILTSSWQANAIPVAEFCLAQILLALKGYFRNSREATGPGHWGNSPSSQAFVGSGIFEERVALIGAGAIATKTQELLQNHQIEVIIIPSRQEKRTISLEEAFRTAFVISNHLPNRTDNRGVLDGNLFRLMRPGAVFINTGRGAQVNEKEFIQVMKERPDLTALLDVTDPEPPIVHSELYTLPNVHLSSHIAGSLGNEVVRMADYAIEEFTRWRDGQNLRYRITEEMLMTH